MFNKLKEPLVRITIAYSIIMFAANMIHPITPTIMTNLQVPDYLFGYSYAAMALASFLLSPLWGKLSDNYGRKFTITIGLAGYALGQWFFAFATTPTQVVLARIFAGAFVGGFSVASLAMVTDLQKGSAASNLTIFSSVSALSGTMGYFLGGLVGANSIIATFAMQSTVLVIAILIVLTLKETKAKAHKPLLDVVKTANPFAVFLNNKQVTLSLWLILGYGFFLNAAVVLYDNSFNYYLKDVLELNSAYNGAIKGIVGVLSLAINTLILLKVIKKINLTKISATLLVASALVLSSVFFNINVTQFILMNIVFLVIYSMLQPMQQAMLSERCSDENRGTTFGMLNALKSMGGVVGATMAGSLYSINVNMPFAGAIFWLLCGVVVVILGGKKRV